MDALTFAAVFLIILAGLFELHINDPPKEKGIFILTDSTVGLLMIMLNSCL